MNNFGDFFECREQTGVPCHCDTNSIARLSGLSLIPNLSAPLDEVEGVFSNGLSVTISKAFADQPNFNDREQLCVSGTASIFYLRLKNHLAAASRDALSASISGRYAMKEKSRPR